MNNLTNADTEMMRGTTIDVVNRRLEIVCESMQDNMHLIRVRYADIANAALAIRSNNCAISRLLDENVSLNTELMALQSVLEKESINGCSR